MNEQLTREALIESHDAWMHHFKNLRAEARVTVSRLRTQAAASPDPMCLYLRQWADELEAVAEINPYTGEPAA